MWHLRWYLLMGEAMRGRLLGEVMPMRWSRRLGPGVWRSRRMTERRKLGGSGRLLIEVRVGIRIVEGWIGHVGKTVLGGRGRRGVGLRVRMLLRAHAAEMSSRGRARNGLGLGSPVSRIKGNAIGQWR
jgi:hypothetical protein